MLLEKFVQAIKEDADLFGPYIEALNKQYPEAAVTDLPALDWFEQFCMFVEQQHDG
jgi:hypothetical protein